MSDETLQLAKVVHTYMTMEKEMMDTNNTTQYRALTLWEALEAKLDKHVIEYHAPGSPGWLPSTATTILNLTFKYRRRITPEVGDMVRVRLADGEWSIPILEFRGMLDGRYICKSICGDYGDWGEIRLVRGESDA